MPQRVGRNVLDLRCGAESRQAPFGGRIVAVARVSGEDMRAILPDRLACFKPGRRRSDRTHLPVALRVGKMDVGLIGVQPVALEALGFRDPKARQEHETYDCKGDWTLAARLSGTQ